MQVQVSTLQSLQMEAWLSTSLGIANERQASPEAKNQLALSDLSQIILRQGWSEVQFSAQSSRLVLRRDGSLALAVETHTSLTARRQQTLLEIHLPASLLGEGLELKAPLTLEVQAWDERMRVQTLRQVSLIKPTRRVEEILGDILSAIQEAFGQKDAKALRLVFDEEALKILSADEKLRKLVQELLSLVQVIQALRQQGQPAETWLVNISGKGKPYWQITEEEAVQSEENRLTLRLIFEPSEPA